MATAPTTITLQDRYRGCLLGLAVGKGIELIADLNALVGDAVGTTAEGSKPPVTKPVTDMVGGA